MINLQNDDKMYDDILGFFDQVLQKNWSSVEYWRICKIKDVNKLVGEVKKCKEKELFEIDFVVFIDLGFNDIFLNQVLSNLVISMLKKDWKIKFKNFFLDDKYFNFKLLLFLFLKFKVCFS